MTRAYLLTYQSIYRCRILFLLAELEEEVDRADAIRVSSMASPRVFDATRRRTVEDLPVSAHLNNKALAFTRCTRSKSEVRRTIEDEKRWLIVGWGLEEGLQVAQGVLQTMALH
ncbi:hypothetical protein PHMEG_00010878 [Phytophthora megakarya]|uniref:Uncharacterized protein n=1 Tax=Phytophthora megakarya TaxID=4795 RepID=A0A225WCL5_9STRA|nr:hypothetical protein PHMEG_00010878 [Phytophthora megakarya]